ncbi:hypothetical protein WI697_10895 [Tistrella mobilis]|uniref:hypothetical protein n=1 Tax=Tistrella mobilis TaxID=171437 RepID=UPI0031F705B7
MVVDGLLAIEAAAAAAAVLAAFRLALLPHEDARIRPMSRVFGVLMGISILAGLGLAIVQPSVLLLIVTLLAIYTLIAGWRANTRQTAEPSTADRMMSGVVIGTGLLTVMAGLTGMIGREVDPALAAVMPVAANVALPVLGLVGAFLAVQDVLEEPGRVRVGRHMVRMLGALAATVTLALVLHRPFAGLGGGMIADGAHWMAPAAVTLPMITMWTLRLRRAAAAMAARRRTPQEAVN